ncbi:MAG: YtxH domain-containing protein [Sporomusaceae bacterium]|nr:YtxH domain-containing protein [Sporomusaceae bacterium]
MSILGIIEKTKRAKEKKARKKVLAGVAVGAVVGAAAGVLLAPKSGKETREELVSAAKQLPDKAKEIAELGKAKLEEVNKCLTEAKAEAAAAEPDKAD